MTGFGRGEAQQHGTTWIVECSSVNRKQFEASIHLPRDLADLETAIRNVLVTQVSRGRIHVLVKSDESHRTAAAPRVDVTLATQYADALRRVAAEVGLSSEISLGELSRMPGVIVVDQEKVEAEAAWPGIEKALGAALTQLIGMRETEGEHLQLDIETRLQKVSDYLVQIQSLAPEVAIHHRQALFERLKQAGLPLPLDDERLLKEVALFADRTDISEELSRAHSHLKQFRTYLAATEPAGRSLDFLVQEFFREFNTMGSKANNADIAHCVVAAKTELEKIREQIQNVE